MTPPGGVEHLLVPAEALDGLGDKAAIPGSAGALDLAFARAAAGFGKDAAIGCGERRVAEQPPRLRRRPMGQVDRR